MLHLVAPALWGQTTPSGATDPTCHPEADIGRIDDSTIIPPLTSLAHGGLCPPSELECPPCPSGTYKCPTGGCEADIRQCLPNVNLRGECSGTKCINVDWCHLMGNVDYACWEAGDSSETASMRFSALNRDKCGYCTTVRSRYPCELCCGTDAEVTWSGTLHRAGDVGRKEGGIFMEGSRWVCMLSTLAASLSLSNVAAGIAPSAAPLAAPPSSSDDSMLALSEEEVLRQTDTPEYRALVSQYDVLDPGWPHGVVGPSS